MSSGSSSSICAMASRALVCACSSSSSLAWIACVSRCSARWMSSVMHHVARTAIPCQPRLSRSKASQRIPYAVTAKKAAG
jgi:hypothetical protein